MDGWDWKDRWTDGGREGGMDGLGLEGWMDGIGRIDGQMEEWNGIGGMDGWSWKDRWTDWRMGWDGMGLEGWMDGWMDGGMGWMDGAWKGANIELCPLQQSKQDFVPIVKCPCPPDRRLAVSVPLTTDWGMKKFLFWTLWICLALTSPCAT